VPAIPNEAIIDYQGKKYMFIVSEETHTDEHEGDEHKEESKEDAHEEGTHFKMVEIATGYSELGYTEITLPEAFDNETQIVIKGAYSLLSKLKNSEEEGGHAH